MSFKSFAKMQLPNSARIFLTVFIACAFFTNTYLTTNDASRFSLTVALAERGSADITDILPKVISPGWKIKDFAELGGRVYSDKAPFGSFAAVPAYLIASRAGLRFPWVIYVVSLLTAGLATAGTATLIYKIAAMWTPDERKRILIAVTYGLGTMALFYGTLFFSSAITAFLGIASFYCLARVWHSAKPDGWAALGGFLAGASVTSDYYAAITAVCLLGYGLSDRRRRPVLMLLGFAMPIALLFLYHNIVFGAPWPLSYRYGYLYGNLHSKGFFGITAPGMGHLKRLGAALFSVSKHNWGFFFANAPVVFSIFAFNKYFRFRREAIMIIVMSAGYLYLNASESWFDAYSARFFMPLLPFLLMPLLYVNYSRRLTRNIFFFILGFSIVVNLIGADGFAPEYIWKAEPGMQNLAGLILGPRGIRLGYGNFAFLALALAPVWLAGRRLISTDKPIVSGGLGGNF
jgi:hypothetical protein